jgi:Fibronectin type-III domain
MLNKCIVICTFELARFYSSTHFRQLKKRKKKTLMTLLFPLLCLGYDDFLSFLCGINGSGPVILNYTGSNCGPSTLNGLDLNLPSITIAVLNRTKIITRTLKNVATNESYVVGFSTPYGVSLSVSPDQFFIGSGQKQSITFVFNATLNSTSASFGKVGFYGDRGHMVIIPVSVISKIVY